jgi:hypothetical protein
VSPDEVAFEAKVFLVTKAKDRALKAGTVMEAPVGPTAVGSDVHATDGLRTRYRRKAIQQRRSLEPIEVSWYGVYA